MNINIQVPGVINIHDEDDEARVDGPMVEQLLDLLSSKIKLV